MHLACARSHEPWATAYETKLTSLYVNVGHRMFVIVELVSSLVFMVHAIETARTCKCWARTACANACPNATLSLILAHTMLYCGAVARFEALTSCSAGAIGA